MSKTKEACCTACGSLNVFQVLKIEDAPAHCNVLWQDKEGAQNCHKGDIELNFCKDCGHLYNQSFDEGLMSYDQEYENTLDFSPSFQKFAKELVERLTTSYDLHGKSIVEIGCGKGVFLKMIAELGGNKAFGFDKSYDPANETEEIPENVTFIQDFYSEKYADYPSDMIISRHVLEHIEFPEPFVKGIKDISSDKDGKKVFYFEVPNILYTLRDMGIWDLIYEHCSYFSATSIAGVFEKVGLNVVNVQEGYAGQFLSIEANTEAQQTYKPYVDVAEIADMVDKFSSNFKEKIAHWTSVLDELKKENKKIVTWGGGSKGVSFLNFLKTGGLIDYIVDINPRKTGMYVAGTGQKYIQPEELVDIKPDVVIIMNPIYEQEISDALKEMGLKVDVMVA